MRAGSGPVEAHDLSSLRFIASVGEPLNPEAVVWGNEKLQDGDPRQLVSQTETGAIMCSNYASMEVRAGSDGAGPIPGIEMAVLDEDYNPKPPGEAGILAVRAGLAVDDARLLAAGRECTLPASRRAGTSRATMASLDEDGYFWFQGRADDVINTAGHLVGPFEVESALIEHPAVAEAGVIGKPGPDRDGDRERRSSR